MTTSALVLGATGLVGRFCLDFLLDDPSWDRVTTVGRRGPGVDDPKLESKVASIDMWSTALHAVPCEAVFCALGTTIREAGSREAFRRVDLDAPLEAAQVAKQAGCRHFSVVSSTGASATSRNFYLRVKGELETALVQLGFESLSIVRPSLLLGPREKTRPAEAVGKVVMSVIAPMMVGPARRYRPVRARAVAAAMVAAAADSPLGVRIVESEEINAVGGAMTPETGRRG